MMVETQEQLRGKERHALTTSTMTMTDSPIVTIQTVSTIKIVVAAEKTLLMWKVKVRPVLTDLIMMTMVL